VSLRVREHGARGREVQRRGVLHVGEHHVGQLARQRGHLLHQRLARLACAGACVGRRQRHQVGTVDRLHVHRGLLVVSSRVRALASRST
jgi:hypothetical protein